MINRKIALLLAAATLTLAPATAHAGIFDFLPPEKPPPPHAMIEVFRYVSHYEELPFSGQSRGDGLLCKAC